MSDDYPKMLCVKVQGDDGVTRIVPLKYRPTHPHKQGYVIFASREEEDQFIDTEAVVSGLAPEQHSSPEPMWPYNFKQPYWIDHLHQTRSASSEKSA